MKRHRTPLAGTVRADPHHPPGRTFVVGEEQRGEPPGFSDLRGADRARITTDHLRVQQWPGRVEVSGMGVATRETGGHTGDHERPDGHAAGLERDR
ncbi:hypothetical protein L687_16830 [Microbacterium maritypicum MF109]|uniref:Uncharacterized protein n=1 Tax=Microbacterium maritypicum MF109 TaxID=1333857 RepID=T5KMM4_MICMQ|nr:hypothetical protein L687_16830 [Microbacterium maritypicum MF109]